MKLHKMGHPQPETPIQVDKLCASGITNNEIKNGPKQWACDSIGYAIELMKSTILCTGYQDTQTKRNTITRTTNRPSYVW